MYNAQREQGKAVYKVKDVSGDDDDEREMFSL